MIENFEKICGVSPQDSENLNFQVSDPNFVFENDPLFETVVLYDRDGNIVNVNSWIECAHYVNGGWSSAVQSGFVGTIPLIQLTVLLYLGYGFLKYLKYKKNNE